jgi:hypothetical protein
MLQSCPSLYPLGQIPIILCYAQPSLSGVFDCTGSRYGFRLFRPCEVLVHPSLLINRQWAAQRHQLLAGWKWITHVLDHSCQHYVVR